MSQNGDLYLFISPLCQERLSTLRTPIAKGTYITLCRYASRSDTGPLPRGTTNVSEKTLAELVGCSDRAIRTAIADLKAAGLIYTQQRYNTSNLTTIPDLMRNEPTAPIDGAKGNGQAGGAGHSRKSIGTGQEAGRNQLPPKSIEEREEIEEQRQEDTKSTIVVNGHISTTKPQDVSETDCNKLLSYYRFLVSPLNASRVGESTKPEVRAVLAEASRTFGSDAVKKALFCYYTTYAKDTSKDPKYVMGLKSLLSSPDFATQQQMNLNQVADFADSWDTFEQHQKEINR